MVQIKTRNMTDLYEAKHETIRLVVALTETK
jgi:hypothetical protein